jgi:hypothetical protein
MNKMVKSLSFEQVELAIKTLANSGIGDKNGLTEKECYRAIVREMSIAMLKVESRDAILCEVARSWMDILIIFLRQRNNSTVCAAKDVIGLLSLISTVDKKDIGFIRPLVGFVNLHHQPGVSLTDDIVCMIGAASFNEVSLVIFSFILEGAGISWQQLNAELMLKLPTLILEFQKPISAANN